MISFRAITEDYFAGVIAMKRPEGVRFAVSNAVSLAQAWLCSVPAGAVNHGDEELRRVLTDGDKA